MKGNFARLGFGRGSGSTPAGASGRARASAWRILGWSLLASLVIGALGLAQPFEDELRIMRNRFRLHPPSGQIVIVGIDDRSLEKIGSWPWPRRRHAMLIDRLRAAGASRIFFDISFATTSTVADDRRFIDALKRSDSVFLAAMRTRQPTTGQFYYKLPRREYRAHAGMVSVAANYTEALTVRQMDYATNLGALNTPTMAAELARAYGPVGSEFFIDYAIAPRKIPFFSAHEVLEGKLDPASLKGKDVVIGAASIEMGDVYSVPGFGQMNGVFVNVIAAETLKAGGTVQVGWLLPLMLGALLAAIQLFFRNRWLGGTAVAVAVAGLIVLPVIAEAHRIFYDVVPALILVIASAASYAWMNFRRSYQWHFGPSQSQRVAG